MYMTEFVMTANACLCIACAYVGFWRGAIPTGLIALAGFWFI